MDYELVIIGAGLAGLQAAITANDIGLTKVLMIEYEKTRGGFATSLFARPGFEKEQALLSKVDGLAYDIWFQSTVVGLFEGESGEKHQLTVQTPTGTKDVTAEKIIISSGSLEKPREAHKISGSRPAGIMTPMMALGLLERGYIPGSKIVLFDNNKISTAIATLLAEKGIDVEKIAGNRHVLLKITGNARVTSVEIRNKQTEAITTYECDTLIFSDGVIPSTFYLKGTMVALDEQHLIITDEQGKTNIARIMAHGDCTTKREQFDVFSEQSKRNVRDFLTV